MPELTSFGSRVSQLAETQPDKIAITFVPQTGDVDSLSWRDLDRWANRVTHMLKRRGTGPGTMVVIGIPNSLEHYVLAIAAWRCGACTLPLSPRAPDREFGDTVDLLQRKIVIADRPDVHLRHQDITATRFDTSLDETPSPPITPTPGKAIASGGSTGRPKIIVDPDPWERVPGELHDTVHSGFASAQIQLVAGPLYHNSPFTWSHFGLFEAHHIILLERFDAATVVDLIEKYRCSFMFFAPTMMQRILRLPDIRSRDLTSIQAIFQTAAICPTWLKRAWIELVGPDCLYEAYGSSEAPGHTQITGRDWLLHPGSVGRAAGCELRILDPEFRELPPGEVGEIFFRPTRHPAPTYFYIGSAPAKTTPDGFISVGDMGHVDEDGWLFIADRRTDLIISGGVNIYPAEVEAALTEHPNVADAAVIGLPDEEWGKRVHAIVELGNDAEKPSAEELMRWMRSRLAPYKLPKCIEFLPSLPRDQSGKIRRAALAKERATAPMETSS
jgi:bile acid-coenzyme A ligase